MWPSASHHSCYSDVNSNQHAHPIFRCTVQQHRIKKEEEKLRKVESLKEIFITGCMCYLHCSFDYYSFGGFYSSRQQYQESCFTTMDIQTTDQTGALNLVILTTIDSAANAKLSYINITTSVAFASVRTAVFWCHAARGKVNIPVAD